MSLILLHPEVAFRSCEECQRFVFDEKTGKRCLWRGEPLLRPDDKPPPCRTVQGCAKGTPEEPRELNERNQQTYRHYRECKAVGQFPVDAIVRQNAAIINAVEEAVRRNQQEMLQQSILALIGVR